MEKICNTIDETIINMDCETQLTIFNTDINFLFGIREHVLENHSNIGITFLIEKKTIIYLYKY